MHRCNHAVVLPNHPPRHIQVEKPPTAGTWITYLCHNGGFHVVTKVNIVLIGGFKFIPLVDKEKMWFISHSRVPLCAVCFSVVLTAGID